MKIEYTITKKRGRYRPILKYKITIEEWEKELNASMAHVDINCINYNGGDIFRHASLNPGSSDDDPNWKDLQTIYAQDGEHSKVLKYYGKNHEYEEIKKSFEELMAKHEKNIIEAYNEKKLNLEICIEMSEQTKNIVAPFAAEYKMKA